MGLNECRNRELVNTGWNWNLVRSFGRKIKRKKAPVEPLPNSPNSLGALLGDRQIPLDMDLREIWDKVTKQQRSTESIDSTTRFQDYSESTRADNEILSTRSSVELSPKDVNRYYELKKGLIQEAFREFYKFTGSDGASETPKRGCKALYDEIQLTASQYILYRRCIHEIMDFVLESEPCRIWMEGKKGSGKSITLVSLVEWARRKNWLVLYLPSAGILTNDYFFTKRPQETKYDTIVSAKSILKSIDGVYGGDDDSSPLTHLRCNLLIHPKYNLGSNLNELCKTGLATNEPELACESVVALLNEILYGNHNVRRLVVIDDYNALYWNTKYYHWKDINNKDSIPGDQAKAFQVFDNPTPLTAHVVAASTYSGSIPLNVWIPKQDPIESVEIPYLNEDEMSCMLFHYWKRNLIHAVDQDAVKRLHAVTGGNMQDIKRSLCVL
eukprot:g7944.t1